MSEKVDHKILLFFNPHLSSHISNSLENSKLSYELIHCTIFLSNHQTDRVSSIPFQFDSIRLIVQYNLLLYLKKKRNFVEFAPSKSLHVRDPLCARINLTLRKIPKNILDPIKFSWSRPRENKKKKIDQQTCRRTAKRRIVPRSIEGSPATTTPLPWITTDRSTIGTWCARGTQIAPPSTSKASSSRTSSGTIVCGHRATSQHRVQRERKSRNRAEAIRSINAVVPACNRAARGQTAAPAAGQRR